MSQNPSHMPPGDAGHGQPPGNPPADGPVVVPLEVLQQALAPLIQSSERTEQEMAQVKTRLTKIEEMQAKHAEGPNTEGNNQCSGGACPKARSRRSKYFDQLGVTKTHPKSQNTFRGTLFSRCNVGKMNELQAGMSEDEWEEKKAEDPELLWRPDFMVSIDSLHNKFWVNKMLDEYMKNTTHQQNPAKLLWAT
ncbi:hypothetical protein FRC06_002495 [Ceratobasidium sp. 370]|nr:hypothetical protein FRC06_002495 [Ceratobasidium sp. 370]